LIIDYLTHSLQGLAFYITYGATPNRLPTRGKRTHKSQVLINPRPYEARTFKDKQKSNRSLKSFTHRPVNDKPLENNLYNCNSKNVCNQKFTEQTQFI